MYFVITALYSTNVDICRLSEMIFIILRSAVAVCFGIGVCSKVQLYGEYVALRIILINYSIKWCVCAHSDVRHNCIMLRSVYLMFK